MKIRHIVLLKLHDFAEGCPKNENALKIKNMLDKLPSQIDLIEFYEVGINQNNSERAADVSVNSSFDSWEDLKNYLIHPAHLKAVEFIDKVRCETRVSDYEY